MLTEISAELSRAASGVDWDASRVEAACRQLARESRLAGPDELAASLELLVGHLLRAGDADGAAYVAMAAGTLVERGASARRLGEVLLDLVPEVLSAARAYADRCLDAMGPEDEEEVDDSEEDAILYVDDRAIPAEVFRSGQAADRRGAAALAHLREWTLPTVAALTRDRGLLHQAAASAEFCRAAAALRKSEASWLHMLSGVQLEASWLVLCPVIERGFRVLVDGVVSNFDLHALLADVLVPLDVPGIRNPSDVIAVIRGEANECRRNYVAGTWNLYTYRAAGHDLREPRCVPHPHWVWGEGQPRDVPEFEGVRTLLIGPAAFERSWNAGRTFAALRARVDVIAELSHREVVALLARFIEATG